MDIDRLKHHIRIHEGLALTPYRCTTGHLSIGYGRNLDAVGISQAEAEMLLTSDVGHVIDGLDRALPWWRQLGESQQLALAEMAFQLGVRGLGEFGRMLHALRVGDYQAARAEALDSEWARQTPQRASEVADLIGAH